MIISQVALCLLVIALSGVLCCQKSLKSSWETISSSMAIIGDRPAVAYFAAGAAETVYFLRAEDHNGAVWKDFEMSSIPLPFGVGSYADVLMKEIDGRPAVLVLQSTSEQKRIHYARASTSIGHQWNDPARTVVQQTTPEIVQMDMIVLNVQKGLPLVVWTKPSTIDTLWFRRALDAGGATWNDPVGLTFTNVVTPGGSRKTISLALLGSFPACAYMSVFDNMMLVKALDVYGDIWDETPIIIETMARLTNPVLLPLQMGGYALLAYQEQSGAFEPDRVWAIRRTGTCPSTQCSKEAISVSSSNFPYAYALSGSVKEGTNIVLFQYTWFESLQHRLNIGTIEYLSSGNSLVRRNNLYFSSDYLGRYGNVVAHADRFLYVAYNDGAASSGLAGANHLVFHGSSDVHGQIVPESCYLMPTSAPTPFFGKMTPPPSKKPTSVPIDLPTMSPTRAPTDAPITPIPSRAPTGVPTDQPTKVPTLRPTLATNIPSRAPTAVPTDQPTRLPTVRPTLAPDTPSRAPTDAPTDPPTTLPTTAPTDAPTKTPTRMPTRIPSPSPTMLPSRAPTAEPFTPGSPSTAPTRRPTRSPTLIPSVAPTRVPTDRPTSGPSIFGSETSKTSGEAVQTTDETTSVAALGTTLATKVAVESSTTPEGSSIFTIVGIGVGVFIVVVVCVVVGVFMWCSTRRRNRVAPAAADVRRSHGVRQSSSSRSRKSSAGGIRASRRSQRRSGLSGIAMTDLRALAASPPMSLARVSSHARQSSRASSHNRSGNGVASTYADFSHFSPRRESTRQSRRAVGQMSTYADLGGKMRVGAPIGDYSTISLPSASAAPARPSVGSSAPSGGTSSGISSEYGHLDTSRTSAYVQIDPSKVRTEALGSTGEEYAKISLKKDLYEHGDLVGINTKSSENTYANIELQ